MALKATEGVQLEPALAEVERQRLALSGSPLHDSRSLAVRSLSAL